MGVSLVTYLAWTLAQMVWRMTSAARYAPVFSSGKKGDEFLAAYNEVEVSIAKQAQSAMRVWPWVFAFATITGFTAAGVVIFFCVASIISPPQVTKGVTVAPAQHSSEKTPGRLRPGVP